MELGQARGRIKSLRFSFLSADLNPSTKVPTAWSNPPPGSGLWFLSTLKIRAGASSGLVSKKRDYCDVRQMFEDLVGRGGLAGQSQDQQQGLTHQALPSYPWAYSMPAGTMVC